MNNVFKYGAITAALAGIAFWGGYKMNSCMKCDKIPDDIQLQSTPVSSNDAHKMVVKFKQDAGYCTPTPPPYEIDSLKLASVGVFEFTSNTLDDLKQAASAISGSYSDVAKFRAIFGSENGTSGKPVTRLILVGLDNSGIEKTASIHLIEGTLPCPLLCDIEKSSIIMGNAGTREDICN